MEKFYTSGNWHVRPGSEDEFVKRWTDFIDQTRDKSPGQFILIRDVSDPKHFVSVGTWARKEDVDAWMAMPEFKESFAAFGDLCDEYQGGPYTHVTSIEH